MIATHLFGAGFEKLDAVKYEKAAIGWNPWDIGEQPDDKSKNI
jgi:hypothetical protein